MKAFRWILFCLLAFGLGTGAAFALHPPTIGIPSATASGLSADLARISDLAAEGRCDGVRGRLRGAASKIDALPARTSAATVDQLTTSLETVRSEALSTCQRISDEKIAAAQRAQEAEQEAQEATTPPEATPEPTPEPSTPTDDSEESVTPDQPDDGGTTPVTPPAGGDAGPGGGGPGAGGGESGNPGGVTIPNGAAIRQQLHEQRKRWEKQARDLRKAWEG